MFIPQSSKRNTAEKYFRVKFREEIILLVATSDYPNVLSPDCLRQAFKAHNAVVELELYSDFCVTLSGNKAKSPDDCTMISSLVVLQFDEIHYSSERSLDDAIAESSGSDVTLVSITFTLMITFSCVMLGKFLNPLTGHTLLANAGVFAVALGIVAGFGLAMWCRVPFVSIVGVLPFLVLGIGIKDMFIMVDELDRQPRELSKTDTIKAVMKRSGATVTMTTMTDLVAFAVSTSTSFPAIK
ncbi:hypothetical protein ACROYT_G022738 [Oculina patagonica]